MKILHCADIHLRGGMDTEEAQAFMTVADMAVDHDADVVVVAGDVFEAKSTPEQRLVVKLFLDHVAPRPVVIIRGNHDEAKDLMIFDDRQNGVYVSEVPETLDLVTRAGQLQVLTFPHFNAGALAQVVDNQMDLGDEGTGLFDNLMDRAWNEIKTFEGQSIVVFHGMVDGACMDNGYIPRQNGIHFSKARLESFDCPVMGGHQHQRQSVGFWIEYPGSITRQTFGESGDDKGAILWTFGPMEEWDTEFLSTHPIPMDTVDATWTPAGWDYPQEDPAAYDGARVRVRCHIPQAYMAEAHAAMDALLADFRHARDLKVEKLIDVTTAVRCEAIKSATTLWDELLVWMNAKGVAPDLVEAAAAEFESLFDAKTPPMTDEATGGVKVESDHYQPLLMAV